MGLRTDHAMAEGIAEDASVVLCDMFAPGFPVMYASPAFLETSGYATADCIGKRHSDIFRGMAADSSAVLRELGHGGAAGMPRGKIEEALACLSRAADAEYEAMASDRERVGYYVTVGRDGAGGISVNEVLLFRSKQRKMQWAYGLGVWRDITREIPVDSLLAAASSGGYAALVEGRAEAAREGALAWHATGGPAAKHFGAKALLAWKAKAAGDPPNLQEPPGNKSKQHATGGAKTTTASTRTPDDEDCLSEACTSEAIDSPPRTTRAPPSPDAQARPAKGTGWREKPPEGAWGPGARPGGRPNPVVASPTQGAAYEELYAELARVSGVLTRETFERDHVAAIRAFAATPPEGPRDPGDEPGPGAAGDDADVGELYQELAAVAGALSADLFAREHMPALRCPRDARRRS